MALSIDYLTKVITVPQADLTLVSGTLYELDTEAFRNNLHTIQASSGGIFADDFFIHNTEVTVAGVAYARTIEITNGWKVEFEDGQYAVRLVGSNNNIFDEGVIVRNQVSVIPTNSGGLVSQEGLLALLTELYQMRGLDATNPWLIRDAQEVSGSIDLAISDDGTTTTVQRQ